MHVRALIPILLLSCAPRYAQPGAAPAQSYAGTPAPTYGPPASGPVNAGGAGGDVRTMPVYQVGEASWYGEALRGRKTASGEPFNPDAMTAAHRTLPFGTWVTVRLVNSAAYVRVRITDRGPFAKGRIIDLSRAAAEQLGMVRAGVAQVALYVEGR